MSTPCLQIRSDQHAASAVLEEIARLCKAHGARWHAGLVVEVEAGQMRLLAPAGTQGTLIHLPTPLLVPIEAACWEEADARIVLRQPPATATSLQRELLRLHGDLYNATAKLPWWQRRHPMRLVESCGSVARAVAALKPGLGGDDGAGPTAAERFPSTRSYGWRPEPGSEERRQVLMPLIDLLNHHHRGAPYRIDAGVMVIDTAQAAADGECFAHYGHRRDALDLALQYGYVDASTPFAHSAPLTIELEGVGYLRVEQQQQRKPMHPLDPPRVALEENGLRLSHLCCHRDHPERVRLMLRLALQGSLQRRGHGQQEAQRLAHQGLEALAAANIRLLEQLVAAAAASDHPGGAVLVEAARRQAANLASVLV